MTAEQIHGLGRLMDIPTTAVYIGRTVAATHQMIKRGKLPVVKLDGKLQIDRLALDRLITKSTEGGE